MKMTMTSVPLRLVLITLAVCVKSWDLSRLGIGENYYVSSAATYKNRAFLTLPRSYCFNNLTNPTLVEVPWTEGLTTVAEAKKRMGFPRGEPQLWGPCEYLQDAISVDVDLKRGRLLVLDKGTRKCEPKLVVYNIRFNVKVRSLSLKGVSGQYLNYVAVDFYFTKDTRAYIAQDEKNRLLVFSMQEERWWTLNLLQTGSFPFTHLCISKISKDLYLTSSKTDALYSVSLDKIYREGKQFKNALFNDSEVKVNGSFAGQKLGPSGGMVFDIAGGLNYYLMRDFAIVRWNSSKPLLAEYHEVLEQSYEMFPYVPHLFLGPQNGVWALVNPSRPLECSIKERRRMSSFKNASSLITRVVQVSKYVKNTKDVVYMKQNWLKM